MSEKYVALPGGLLWPKSLGTHIPEGFNYHERPDGSHILVRKHDLKEYKLQEPTKEAKEWRAELNEAKKRKLERPDFVAVPAGGVWQALAGTDTTRYITQFNSTWTVPTGPNISNSHGQTLFYWNGITPSFGGSPLLQPVLQWGTSGAGTPSNGAWAVACWKVVDGSSFAYSTLYNVTTGAALTGSIGRISSTEFNVAMLLNGSQVVARSFTGLNADSFFHADMVLENANMTACADNVVAGVNLTNQFIADSFGYAATSWTTYAAGGCAYSATNHGLGNPGGYVTLQG